MVKRFFEVHAIAVAIVTSTLTSTVFADNSVMSRTELSNFGLESASEEVRQFADWVVHTRDSQTLPFVIVDKKNAKVFVLNSMGHLKGAAPALLGSAIGDDSAQGIGQLKLSSIPPAQRTTPAGRFVASLSKNLKGKSILWIDYDAAISMHRVVTSNPTQQRAQRLASSTVADNRISFGCINVPAEFYDRLIEDTFKHTNGIVYVLPETKALHTVFNAYRVDAQVNGKEPQLSSTLEVPAVSSLGAASSSNAVIKLR